MKKKVLDVTNFKSVQKLLCRNLSVSGNVFHGDKMGRTINFPTINIKYKSSLLNGVYEVKTIYKGKLYIGLANIESVLKRIFPEEDLEETELTPDVDAASTEADLDSGDTEPTSGEDVRVFAIQI